MEKIVNYIKEHKSTLLNKFIVFLSSAVIVFTIIFFFILPPKYDVILYIDNVKGNSKISTSLSNSVSFSHSYTLDFNLDEDIQELGILGYCFDNRYFSLIFSETESIDIEGFDVIFSGIKLYHRNLADKIKTGETDKVVISKTQNGDSIHIVFKNTQIGTKVSFDSHFAPWWFYLYYGFVVLGASLIMYFALSKISSKFQIDLLLLVKLSFCTFTLLCGMLFCGSYPYVKSRFLLINILLVFAGSILFDSLLGKARGTILCNILVFGFFVANYFVLLFRGKPILPNDFKAFTTAKEVMGAYEFSPTSEMFICTLSFIGFIFLLLFYQKTTYSPDANSNKTFLNRLSYAAISALTIAICLSGPTFKSLETFAWDVFLVKDFHEEGMILSFIGNLINSRVREPETYSDEVVNSYLLDYSKKAKEEVVEGIQPVNIIMVMNEAFSDLREVGLDERIDVMPFYDSLIENTIKGDLYVSIYGGGTCNTEFEALTGNSLAFLGKGSYPYVEYIDKNLFSLAWFFSNLEYDTQAFHSNLASNWNRNKVYNLLGFNKFNSQEDYPQGYMKDTIHKQPKDSNDYKFIHQTENAANTPSFLFNVTMQNHSGYERFEDVPLDETVGLYGKNLYTDAQVYLSLIKVSDEALEELVSYYSESDEPTMIIFFGDHQPGLPQEARSTLYNDIESYLDMYKTKFFIWTNYDIPEKQDVKTSANYLPLLIIEYGNFDYNAWFELLKECYTEFPILSSMGVMDSEGNLYDSIDSIDDDIIKRYQNVQYANMFDTISSKWFE